jgi:O-Antigen ligase
MIGLIGIAILVVHNHQFSLRAFGIEDIFFVGFLLVSIYSWYVNRSDYPDGRGVTQIINNILTYGLFKFCLLLMFKTEDDPDILLRRVFRIYTFWQIPAIVILFLGILFPGFLILFTEFFNNSGNFSIGAIGESLETARSFGFAPEPSFWSFFVAVNLAIALILPRPNAALLSINFLSLILTVGRTGFLIALCIIIIRFASSNKILQVLLVIAGLFALFLGLEYLDLRELQTIDPSFDQRIDSLFVAFQLTLDHPVFGIGLGNFRVYAGLQNLAYADIFNLFLNLLVSVGVTGFALYMGALYFSYARIKPEYRLPFYAAVIGWLTVSSYNLPFVWITFSILVYTSEYRAKSEMTDPISQ